MYLTLREAAVALKRTPRTIRYLIQKGQLPAVRRGAAYFVRAEDLPLTVAQRQELLARSATVREIVADALVDPLAELSAPAAPASSAAPPVAHAHRSGLPAQAPAPAVGTHRPRRTTLDLDVARDAVQLHALLGEVARQAGPALHATLSAACGALAEAVTSLCRFVHLFDAQRKAQCIRDARESLCKALAFSLLAQAGPPVDAPALPDTPLSGAPAPVALELARVIERLEQAILPALGSLARRLEKKP